jgi:hypothetical protein
MPMELILNKKKGMCHPHVPSVFEEICPKTFGKHCVCTLCRYSLRHIAQERNLDHNRLNIYKETEE